MLLCLANGPSVSQCEGFEAAALVFMLSSCSHQAKQGKGLKAESFVTL